MGDIDEQALIHDANPFPNLTAKCWMCRQQWERVELETQDGKGWYHRSPYDKMYEVCQDQAMLIGFSSLNRR